MPKQLNIDKLINFIESEHAGFGMGTWFRSLDSSSQPHRPFPARPVCGTAACIGGSCDMLRFLSEDGTTFSPPEADSEEATIQWLLEGLPPGHSFLDPDLLERAMFYPRTDEADWNEHDPASRLHISRARAVAMLRNFAKTGEVQW
jgi:hypothetical protein